MKLKIFTHKVEPSEVNAVRLGRRQLESSSEWRSLKSNDSKMTRNHPRNVQNKE